MLNQRGDFGPFPTGRPSYLDLQQSSRRDSFGVSFGAYLEAQEVSVRMGSSCFSPESAQSWTFLFSVTFPRSPQPVAPLPPWWCRVIHISGDRPPTACSAACVTYISLLCMYGIVETLRHLPCLSILSHCTCIRPMPALTDST